ncbi:MAG: PAS domain S-box protein [Deltaproteobacteria bacterium]|nr:PAS domain S-box protein [Deltaproteobacteria bacterium]
MNDEIRDRERVQRELQSSERRLSDIINFLPDATFVIDLEGRVIAWNHSIEELTGTKAEEMVGKGDYGYAIPFYGKRRPALADLALRWDEEWAEKYEYVKREEKCWFPRRRIHPLERPLPCSGTRPIPFTMSRGISSAR